VRLQLTEDGEAIVEASPLELSGARLRVAFALSPIDPTDVFLFHKTTNRVAYERLRLPGVDDVILWNPRGEVTESIIANVVAELDGQRVTPPVECGLLAGTFRAELLSAGEIAEATVTVDQLAVATRVWLINSVRGWCPADLVAPPSLVVPARE
jgi:para-aminobenzoate synthetase/4-amino-4-deoxychorismate lyase